MHDVLLVDDHPIFRAGLGQLIDEAPDFRVCGSESDASAAVRHIRDHDCAAAVLDIDMPSESGLEVLPKMLELRPRLPVVMLTFHAEEQYAVRAVQLGARGYLTKSAAGDELVTALRTVIRGGLFVSSEVVSLLARGGATREAPAHERLSDRERQVLRLIAQGLSNGEISDALSLSPKTVSTYKTRVLAKLELRSTADVVRYALEHGLAR
jgi:DNA-binding NarL/FixJ family response regulator